MPSRRSLQVELAVDDAAGLGPATAPRPRGLRVPTPAAWKRSLRWPGAAGGLVAGCDEAGRGPLAGPVVAAAVILDELQPIAGLADSKALTPTRRDHLDAAIRARALAFSVAEASVEEIDRLNILHATMLAMQRAVEGLRLMPHHVLVDGNRKPPIALPCDAVVKGDARVRAISAASILAKVHRDRLCVQLHACHPEYRFDVHKGYPTPEHLEALKRHGASPVHRRSFAPVRACLGGPGDLRAPTEQPDLWTA